MSDDAPLGVLIHNPTSGPWRARRTLGRLLETFERAGRPLEVRPTTGTGHAGRLAAEAIARSDGAPLDLFVLGGDGTLNEVVAGALAAGALEGEPTFRLGLLPAGTTNVVARDLGLPLDPLAAARRILLGGGERPFDVGIATSEGGQPRPFLLCCGVGLDAEAATFVSRRLKRWIGRHAYAVAALPRLGARAEPLVVDYTTATGARESDVTAAWVVIGNTRFYGGAARLSRAAASDDGLLELVLLPSTELIPLIRAGLSASWTEIRACPGVRVVEVTRAAVRASGAVPFHVDAEPAGTAPVSITVRPKALRMLVGAEQAVV